MISIGFSIQGSSDYDISGIAGTAEELERRASVALDESAAAILNRLRTNFRDEKNPFGVNWVPSAAGLRRKAAGTGQTLFDTGRLFRSIQLYKNSELEREIATDVPYAGYVQNGKVPRPFIQMTPEHERLALSIFQFRLSEALNA